MIDYFAICGWVVAAIVVVRVAYLAGYGRGLRAAKVPDQCWSSVLRWWIVQHPRWHKNGAIHQNVYDVVVDDELRQRIAPFLQMLFPETSTCEHCHWPWHLVDSHTTMLTESSGCFVVCEHCWRHLRSFGREDEIRRLYHLVRERHWPDRPACVVDAALDQDFGPSVTLHMTYPSDDE